MRKGGGKSKGGAFEREIAKKLSLWFTNGIRDDIFARSVSSGAWSTIRKKVGKSTVGQAGDIQAIDPSGHPFIAKYSIELKRGYGKYCILDIVDKTKNAEQTIEKFIAQAESNRVASGAEYFLLICRRDGRQSFILSELVFYKLQPYVSLYANSKLYFIYNLDSFLSNITAKELMEV